MIKIGLTGFGDHEELYGKIKPADRLPAYSAYFSIVEIDSSFYAVQPVKNYVKWVNQTPEQFKFIVKAYQGMTGHLRDKKNYYDTPEEMYRAFHTSIAPVRSAGKLAMTLFQFPPWFDCTKDNVEFLREAKERMLDVPSAIEFRNDSWYSPELRSRTLQFLEQEGWIHTIADEPQAGSGSIPIVPVATTPDITYVRLHGRNTGGWNQSSHPDWRKLRYLYRYSTEELVEWKNRLLTLTQSCRDIYVVFNNNSAGDATPNAQELQSLLGIDGGLAPRQLDLFT
ncbi:MULTISPECIES: DUF72 domain-containing protein [unclassified Paenibacillus]|jgi:uncharacterized protein YecE (DUF72 family)|uniref:DUF72 domain-containing protein n=1 Tax=unclassified Paenibacillus TaxID=185978 RepID=UPI0004F74F6E|nr:MULTISPECIES: DUF72 domain-containing protein [unclassified Paenibacillus]AIQ32863.1 hypothetical protein P40081_35740 [Paenibacillus sp. FSL P4-0081]OMF22674.1 hypothetical protein BK132_29485 [Paenibacillus sp. FSL H8-0259]